MKTILHRGLVTAALFLLSACATRRLPADFGAVSEGYARDMNWQMLLNLARLDQGHPPYFMAIGEVRVARTQSGSLQASANSSHNVANTVTNVLSGNLTGNTASSATPSFLYIPVNSEDTTQQLLSPIPIEVFDTLYQQGWPVDQLLRVVVERIEVTFPDGRSLVLTNSPTRGPFLSYERFLRTCAFARHLQKIGALRLVVTEEHPPVKTPDDEAAGPTSRVHRFEVDAPMLDDALHDFGAPAFAGRTTLDPRRELPPGGDIEAFREDPRDLEFLDLVLRGGLSIAMSEPPPRRDPEGEGARRRGAAAADDSEDSPRNDGGRTSRSRESVLRPGEGGGHAALSPAAGTGETSAARAPRTGTRTLLILRSYRNILEAVALEQRTFDEMDLESSAHPEIPASQRRPILRTDWGRETAALERPVIDVTYAGHAYQITDPVSDVTSLESRWNRDVFRLLVNLSSQVTVDITKFQRQVLELTP